MYLVGLRPLRRRTGVRSGAFSERVGYSRSAYISIENGARPASPEGAERIIKELAELGVPATLGTPLADGKVPVIGTVPDEPPKQPKKSTGPKRREDAEEERTGPKRVEGRVA